MSTNTRCTRLAALLLLSALALTGCDGGNGPSVMMPATTDTATEARSLGLIEVTITGIGTDQMTAEAIPVTSVGVPEKSFTADSGGLDLLRDSLNGFNSGTRGAAGAERYLYASFKARNAQYCSSPGTCTAYTVASHNLTLIGAITSSTINQTSISKLFKFDGSAADTSLATQILPIHAVDFNGSELLVQAGLDSFQVFTENEIASIVVDSGVTALLPYGFAVENLNTPGSRSLPANPANNDYEGRVTLGFKLPLQSSATNDPYSISFLFDVVDDTNTRVTESVDEQNAVGDQFENQRAALLGSTDFAVLGGTHAAATNIGDPICTVRIAGTASSPTTYLVNNNNANVAAAPYNLSGLSPTGSINAGFCQAMKTPSGSAIYSQFPVSGSQSGAKPSNTYGSYGGGGSAVLSFTPTTAHAFFPGEQVNYTLTSNLVSVNSANPTPFTGSFTVGGLLPSLGQFVPVTTTATGNRPTAVVAYDFNGDGIKDLATANYSDSTVTVLLGNGDGTYHSAPGSPITISGGINPVALAAADFNGDGITDLAVVNTYASSSNHNNGTVALLISSGTGSFTQPNAAVALGDGPDAITVGDFKGDGNAVDLAVVNAYVSTTTTSNGSVSILINKRDGSGTFTAASVSPTVGTAPVFVAVGDFNSDGKTDLAVSNYAGNTVSILLRTGVGTFSQPSGSPFAVGSDPNGIAVGDFNGDGKADLAVANEGDSSGDISILLNKADGSGNFNTATKVTDAGSHPYQLVAGDFNGDGKPDLAVTNIVSGNVSILLGSGGGAFGAASDSPIGLGGEPYAIASADLNGDGRIDLVATNFGSPGNVSVLLGDGGGVFSIPVPPANSPVTVTAASAYATVAADFNGDGLLDFAVTSYASSGTVSVFLAQAGGGYVAASGSPYSVGSYSAGLAVGDFNNDGHPDLAVANFDSGTVSIFTNNGSGSFTLSSSPAAGSQSYAIAAGDFNGDGYADLAVTNSLVNGTVSILTNNKSGGFTLTSSPAVGYGPQSIVAGDFNGDGKIDLAVMNNTNFGTVSILTNSGSGSFTLTSSPAVGSVPYAITSADFNHDGSPDLAVVNESSNTVSILTNNGSGSFTLTASPAVGSAPVAITTADFNGDGYPDLAVSNNGDNNVSILLGSALGTFSAAANSPIAVGNGAYGIVAGDFFGRHKLGLAVANVYDSTVTVLPQK